MLRKILLALPLLCMPALTGCGGSFKREPIKEVHLTRMKLGTPAYVVNEAGKAQVVRVQVVGADGTLQPGKVDANGMVLIDEPTLEHYRKQSKKARPEQ